MTDTMTFQNIDISSRDIVYIHTKDQQYMYVTRASI
jgi:hypothetical protein